MKQLFFFIAFFMAFAVQATPGQYQINQACLDVGCFSGDDPSTKTVEITKRSGTFILTSNIYLTNTDAGAPVILVDDNLSGQSAVVIDLNGYEMKFAGTATSTTHGIVIRGRNSVVTVKNGKIASFHDGIRAEGGSTLIAENLTFRIQRDDAIQAGIGVIRDSVFDANEYGINALNAVSGGSGFAGDRLYVDSNLFIDDTGEQQTVFGFSSSNYCKDNVIAYDDSGAFGGCSLAGDNLCDNGFCTVSRNTDSNENKE